MKTFLIGLAIGIILLPLITFLYMWLGYAPVATAAAPLPFEKRLASMALNARIAKEAPKQSPIQPTEQSLMSGAKIYRQQCAVCHGLPGQPETAIAKGMSPSPPQLFRGKGVTDDPAGETYWKAAHGIRLSGMPGFAGSLSDQALWQVSLLLAGANALPQSVKEYLAQPE